VEWFAFTGSFSLSVERGFGIVPGAIL